MSKWIETTLHNKIEIKHGFPFKSEYFTSEGEYIVLTPGNFFEEGGFKREIGKEKFYNGSIPKEYLHKKDDLIVAMTEQAEGLLGSCAFIPEDNIYLHNQRLGLITVKDPSVIDLKYIYHLFKTKRVRKQIRLTSTGSKVKHTSPERIYDVKVYLPPVDYQRQIANFLNQIDKKIELNNRINTELESMAKLIYDYWFVQFDFPDEKGNPYKSSGGKMVWNEELKREIPAGWEVKSLGLFANIKKGDLITEKEAISGNIKVIAAGVTYSYMHNKANRKAFTITVSGSGANAGIIRFWREPIFASDCITIRGNSDIETILIRQFMIHVQEYLFKQAKGSAQPHVYPDDIKNLYYVLPPKEIVDSIARQFINWNTKIAKINTENQKLINLRDWLLPMLMNGQVTVGDAEK